ncbi:hypothetical protein [Aquibaculum sediminis]|uniref:hypothetical protein n=1 Tax=Aquibaculum sediminis TaxID=3231907 RepID=UPI003455314F
MSSSQMAAAALQASRRRQSPPLRLFPLPLPLAPPRPRTVPALFELVLAGEALRREAAAGVLAPEALRVALLRVTPLRVVRAPAGLDAFPVLALPLGARLGVRDEGAMPPV